MAHAYDGYREYVVALAYWWSNVGLNRYKISLRMEDSRMKIRWAKKLEKSA